MANPAIVSITPVNTWAKIATAVFCGKIIAIDNNPKSYFYDYRLTGESAPSDDSTAKRFNKVIEKVESQQLIDIYVKTKGSIGSVIFENLSIFGNSISPFGAIYKEDIENKAVFDEKLFSISKRLTIGSSDTVYILIDPTAVTKENLIFIPPIFEAFGAGPIEIDIFQNPTYTGGTVITGGNRNLASSNTPELIFKLNPSITDPGTQLPFEFIIQSKSSSTPVTTSIGGSTKEDLIFIPNKANEYLFRLLNTEAAACDGAHAAFNWIESD
jgi:hypothetical protein